MNPISCYKKIIYSNFMYSTGKEARNKDFGVKGEHYGVNETAIRCLI